MLGEEKKQRLTKQPTDRSYSQKAGRRKSGTLHRLHAPIWVASITRSRQMFAATREKRRARRETFVACSGGTKGSERDSECVSPALRSHPEQGSLFANPPTPTRQRVLASRAEVLAAQEGQFLLRRDNLLCGRFHSPLP